MFIIITIIKHVQRFDNTRARAYRTKASRRKAKGYREYKDLYGDHSKRKRNYSVNANTTTNANTANNWNCRGDDDDDGVMAELLKAFKRPKVNKYVNSTSSDKFTAEESTLTSFTTTSTSVTGEQQSAVESDLESTDLSSSDEEYALLDSDSSLDFSSHYSATGNESEIPDEPYWMIF